jgi:hypothetical protein
MSKEEYIKELLRWVSSESLLVIDQKGQIRRLFCPFKVICLVDFPDIAKGEKVAVSAVKMTFQVKEVYIINGVPYFIIYFKIIIEN